MVAGIEIVSTSWRVRDAPTAHGQSLGSGLPRPALEIFDTDGAPANLESSRRSSIAIYARHGFRVVREISLPRGPTAWAMWREPLGAERRGSEQ